MEMEVQGLRVRGREAQVALEGLTEGEDLWRRERGGGDRLDTRRRYRFFGPKIFIFSPNSMIFLHNLYYHEMFM